MCPVMASKPIKQLWDGFDGGVAQEKVVSRADGRLPQEGDSENPQAQAEAILEESEERTAEGFHSSDPTD